MRIRRARFDSSSFVRSRMRLFRANSRTKIARALSVRAALETCMVLLLVDVCERRCRIDIFFTLTNSNLSLVILFSFLQYRSDFSSMFSCPEPTCFRTRNCTIFCRKCQLFAVSPSTLACYFISFFLRLSHLHLFWSSDEAQSLWVWRYEGNDAYYDIGEDIKVRVMNIEYAPNVRLLMHYIFCLFFIIFTSPESSDLLVKYVRYTASCRDKAKRRVGRQRTESPLRLYSTHACLCAFLFCFDPLVTHCCSSTFLKRTSSAFI